MKFMKKIKVGILGGAFNPPHQAHLLLADYAFACCGLEKLIFVPLYEPPHKEMQDSFTPELRSLMIKIACFFIEPEELMRIFEEKGWKSAGKDFLITYKSLFAKKHNPKIEVSDSEIERKGVSYTIDTVKEFLEKNPDWNISLIMGMDQATALESWKDWKELSRLVSFCVADRGEMDREEVKKKFPFMNFFPFPDISLSSTLIRENWKEGKSSRGLLPLILEDFYDFMISVISEKT
jgi:nicotinate-nucleotide adenylyltransferase